MSKLDCMRSVEIRRRLGLDTSIECEVRRARLRLFGHIMRMDDDRIAKTLVMDSMSKKSALACDGGKVGGRCKSWLRCVEEDLRMRGYALFSASRLALKREVYRRKVVLG